MHLDATALLVSSILGWFGKVYTSTYVVDEALTLTKAKIGGEEAVKLADSILRSTKVSVINVEDRDGKMLKDALASFRKHREIRGLSFTDCTTLSIQEKMKIGTVLSFDRDFLPLVPRLFGEGYRASLSRDENDILTKATEKLGIEL